MCCARSGEIAAGAKLAAFQPRAVHSEAGHRAAIASRTAIVRRAAGRIRLHARRPSIERASAAAPVDHSGASLPMIRSGRHLSPRASSFSALPRARDADQGRLATVGRCS